MIKIEISTGSMNEKGYESFDTFFSQKVERLSEKQSAAIICIINRVSVDIKVEAESE